MQQDQVFELKKRAVDGRPVWAYRYRTDGPGSRRIQRGGFSSERDAAEALERTLEHLRRQKGVGSTLTLKELVEEYLGQYDAEPETIKKLCWLLAKALRTFGGRRLPELRSQEIAARRARRAARAALRAAGTLRGRDRFAARRVDGARSSATSTDLSRYMGASLTMIDRHYGDLARDGREHAIRLLDGYADIKAADVQALDVRWTPRLPIVAGQDNGNST